MCGIAGCVGFEPVGVDRVDKMFKAIQKRGPQAFGCAYLIDGQWKVLKGVGRYIETQNRDFVLSRIEKDEPHVVLCHTRLASSGSPANHDNNHPIVGNKHLIIHNGVVWTPRHYRALGETDTEQMLLHIEAKGHLQALPEIDGWMAICTADVESPQTIRLYTDGGAPLYTGCTKERFAFASVPLDDNFRPAAKDELLVVALKTLRRRYYPVQPKKHKGSKFEIIPREFIPHLTGRRY